MKENQKTGGKWRNMEENCEKTLKLEEKMNGKLGKRKPLGT
jgi:hypothetical protein